MPIEAPSNCTFEAPAFQHETIRSWDSLSGTFSELIMPQGEF